MSVTETERVEKIVATAKLETLLEKPKATVTIQPDGGVKVTTASLWKRIISSSVMWIQAAWATLATVWLAVPQETFMAIIPAKYVAWGMIFYAITNALARMRTI